MQIIYVLGLAILALSVIGTATLSTSSTDIDIWVQAVGWGEEDLVSPVADGNASIELLLDTIQVNPPITFITACAFNSTEDIPLGTGKSDGLIICKILNADGNTIAEGFIPLTVSAVNPNVAYDKSETLIIDITQKISSDSTHIGNFFDAMVIVEAPL